jgi:hypothetical protein
LCAEMDSPDTTKVTSTPDWFCKSSPRCWCKSEDGGETEFALCPYNDTHRRAAYLGEVRNWISQSYRVDDSASGFDEAVVFVPEMVDLVTEKPSTLRRCTEQTPSMR